MTNANRRDERLLYSRDHAAKLLDTSVPTLIRWERAGRLRSVKPSGSPGGKAYYLAEDIHALAEGSR